MLAEEQIMQVKLAELKALEAAEADQAARESAVATSARQAANNAGAGEAALMPNMQRSAGIHVVDVEAQRKIAEPRVKVHQLEEAHSDRDQREAQRRRERNAVAEEWRREAGEEEEQQHQPRQQCTPQTRPVLLQTGRGGTGGCGR